MTDRCSNAGTSPLVIYYKQLGDILLLEPALAKLAHHRQAPVMLATRPAFLPLLSLMEHVVPMPMHWFRRASEVISFDPRARACILAATTFSERKILAVSHKGRLRPWHPFFFPEGINVSNDSRCYRAKYFHELVAQESELLFRPPQLCKPPPEWLPQGLPSNYVVIHATSAWQRKCWLVENWVWTLSTLSRAGVGPFVVTGGGGWEVEYADLISRSVGDGVLNLCGKTNLKEYIAIVANAKGLLCVDGSSSHIASAYQVPALTLFGPTSSVEWHWPTAQSKALNARDYSDSSQPKVSDIPREAVVAEFLCLLALVRRRAGPGTGEFAPQ